MIHPYHTDPWKYEEMLSRAVARGIIQSKEMSKSHRRTIWRMRWKKFTSFFTRPRRSQ